MLRLSRKADTWGTLLVGASVTVWAGFWIFALAEPRVSVWSLPTWACLGVALIGAILSVASPSDSQKEFTMKQRGGRGSTNIQAGRDIRFRGDSDG
jgi:hypothetical protein